MYDKVKEYVKAIEGKWWIFLLLLMIIISMSMSIRLDPLPNLIDSTTGRYLPSALDPFYFMRASEHILAGGSLSDTDNMRYLGAGAYSTELLSHMNVVMYKIFNVFAGGDLDFRYVNVISPVIYFGIAMFIFYFLMLRILSSRYGAIISTSCLAFTTLFLQRTAAGFSDHEAIGVMFFFIAMYYMVDFFKDRSSNQPVWVSLVRKYVLFPLAMALTLYSWGGMARMMFIIYPAFFFFMNLKFILARRVTNGDISEDYLHLHQFLLTFISLNIIMLIFSLMGGLPYMSFLNAYVIFYMGIALQFMVAYAIVSYLIYTIVPIILGTSFAGTRNYEKELSIWSISFTFVVGLIGIVVTGKFMTIIRFLQSPLLKSRIGQTVAENQAISLLNLQDHVGVFFFVMFIVAAIIILYPFITGIIDWLYNKRNMIGFVDKRNYFYLTILIVAMYSFNSSIRLMFLNSIFLSMFVGIVVAKTFNAYYNGYKGKDVAMGNLYRTLSVALLVTVLITSLFSIYTFYVMSSLQAKQIGPSANHDWQQAMKWVRENTTEDSLFIHWWDYGYWVQTLGERPTVTDGGHASTYWDHLIGRYLLTTPNQESAYELMNTYGVKYFLIDPSDIPKYSAYSSIGDDEPDTDDRTSYVGQFIKQPKATQEFVNSTTFHYSGQMIFDEDYSNGKVLLPAYKSGIVQLSVNLNNDGTFGNITGIAVDQNGIGVNIKFRYIYVNNQLYDLGDGYPGVIRFVPSYSTTNGAVDVFGGALVLTPRVMSSFFARTYILEDHQFMKVAYEGQRYGTDKFLYVNGRLVGPITIYEVLDNPYGTNEGFLELTGKYSAFDDMYYS